MDLSQNTQVDLLYLTNPNFKIKYNKKQESFLNEEDVKFYRKRILHLTKQLLKNEVKTTPSIKASFNDYINGINSSFEFLVQFLYPILFFDNLFLTLLQLYLFPKDYFL